MKTLFYLSHWRDSFFALLRYIKYYWLWVPMLFAALCFCLFILDESGFATTHTVLLQNIVNLFILGGATFVLAQTK